MAARLAAADKAWSDARTAPAVLPGPEAKEWLKERMRVAGEREERDLQRALMDKDDGMFRVRISAPDARRDNRYHSRIVHGAVPRGYQVEGDALHNGEGTTRQQHLMRDLGLAGQVTEIITGAAAGDSAPELARRYGLPDSAVREIILNRVYSTGKVDLVDHGDCPKDGTHTRLNRARAISPTCIPLVALPCAEPLVSPEVQDRAIATLDSRNNSSVPLPGRPAGDEPVPLPGRNRAAGVAREDDLKSEIAALRAELARRAKSPPLPICPSCRRPLVITVAP